MVLSVADLFMRSFSCHSLCAVIFEMGSLVGSVVLHYLHLTSREGLRHVAIMRSDKDGTILAHNNTRFRLVLYIEKGGERSAGSG